MAHHQGFSGSSSRMTILNYFKCVNIYACICISKNMYTYSRRQRDGRSLVFHCRVISHDYFECVNICIYLHIYIYIYICIYISKNMYTYSRRQRDGRSSVFHCRVILRDYFECVYIYIYVYIYISVFIYVYLYIQIYVCTF